MKISQIQTAIKNASTRSAWARGVQEYAEDLLKRLCEDYSPAELSKMSASELSRALLNGARDWREYSWGGCSLIYNADIAACVCTPSEMRRTGNGSRRPNSKEEWLDIQARALFQAARLIVDAARSDENFYD